MFELIQNLDGNLLLWIQNNLRGPLDGILSFYTNLGEAGILWIAISVVMLCIRKTRRAGLTALAAMGVCYLFNDVMLKHLVCRPRPFVTVEGLVPLIKGPGSWSFPSGHSCSSLAAASAWWRTVEWKSLRVVLLALAILMALSRLYVGVHYPSDVLVGALIGTIGGQLVWKATQNLPKKKA
jgi:undecaprenyl-diphosphatase